MYIALNVVGVQPGGQGSYQRLYFSRSPICNPHARAVPVLVESNREWAMV